jgi:signal transduction histidine kinase
MHIFLVSAIFFTNKHILILDIFNDNFGKNVILDKTNYLIYAIYFVCFVLLSYYNLFRSYIKSVNIEERSQLIFLIYGTLFGFAFGMFFNLILPYFDNYRYIFLGPLFSLAMVVSIAYSITKHRLFNVKIIATEVLIFVLWIFILLRFLISTTLQEQIINAILFVATIIIGILLINSVVKEVKQREKIELLAKDLEVANEKLKELDQMKSEFLSLATHQIRAPLTAIKGYASLILEGDYGVLPEKMKTAVSTIFESCQNLVFIVNDFLDISRIEQGRMKYDKTEFDIIKTCSDILDQLKPNIENAGLKYSFNKEMEKAVVFADIGKIKQIIGNVIDNSIKYTKTGDINLGIKKVDDNVLISVKDTGVGISKDDIPKLFAKFVRAKDASKTNVIGTGLGLYIAKQMLEAQGGKIWVESEGLGKGSTFFIQIPIKIN